MLDSTTNSPADHGLELAIAALAAPTATVETIAEVRNTVRARLERAKALMKAADEACIEHIEANGGAPIVCGDVELRATYPRETKNRPDEKRRTLRELFTATGGDMDAVADCLCSDPFKPGTVKTVLPADVFGECFEIVEKAKLVEGVRKKQLVAADTRFTGTRNQ